MQLAVCAYKPHAPFERYRRAGAHAHTFWTLLHLIANTIRFVTRGYSFNVTYSVPFNFITQKYGTTSAATLQDKDFIQTAMACTPRPVMNIQYIYHTLLVNIRISVLNNNKLYSQDVINI
jgi:hypothetical protein